MHFNKIRYPMTSAHLFVWVDLVTLRKPQRTIIIYKHEMLTCKFARDAAC